jgi:hypothetical protein
MANKILPDILRAIVARVRAFRDDYNETIESMAETEVEHDAIWRFCEEEHKRAGGATPDLRRVYRAYLRSQKLAQGTKP